METTTTETKERRKPGPMPGPETVKTSISLPPDVLEWGKRQPGGLSETIRQLMAAAMERQGSEGKR